MGVLEVTAPRSALPARHLRARAARLGAGGLTAVLAAILLLGAAVAGEAPLRGSDERAAERDGMVETQIRARGVRSPAVLAAMRGVPRHRFVPMAVRHAAYDDRPLPIGDGQTISQPFVVARMTELAGLKPTDRVYELGTGSGYQAAVAARIAAHVYTVEIQPRLAERARRVLGELEIRNVTVRTGDGYAGWPEQAPFDAILVTAASPDIPRALVEQLKVGGRMVIPVGAANSVQQLKLLLKRPHGTIETREIFPVRFVPVVRESGKD